MALWYIVPPAEQCLPLRPFPRLPRFFCVWLEIGIVGGEHHQHTRCSVRRRGSGRCGHRWVGGWTEAAEGRRVVVPHRYSAGVHEKLKCHLGDEHECFGARVFGLGVSVHPKDGRWEDPQDFGWCF